MPGVPQKGVATLWLDSDDGWTFKNKGEKVFKTIGFQGKSKVQTRKIGQFFHPSSEKLTVSRWNFMALKIHFFLPAPEVPAGYKV